MNERLAAWLREARARRGLSQRDLADLAGVDQGRVSRLERGQVGRPKRETVERLAAALGGPVERALSAAGYPIPADAAAMELLFERFRAMFVGFVILEKSLLEREALEEMRALVEGAASLPAGRRESMLRILEALEGRS